MNKKQILKLGLLLIAIILIIFLAIFILNNKTIVNIKMKDNGEQNSLYQLKIKKNGDYKLKIETKISDDSNETTNITYNDKLTDLELEKVDTIINYVKEHNNISKNKSFKYDYEKDNEYSGEIIGIIENMVIAIENISMGETKINEISRREFGNTMLDNIISTQL